MFSRRLPSTFEPNRLSRAVADIRARGETFLDLTETNPTRADLPYPAALLTPLADARGLTYDPQPLGMRSAREAVAADCRRRGADVDPDCVVLTASTSEAYSWLFKVLCDPGDSVLVPRPSYPLFEHLTRLEGVGVATYDLDYHGRWEIDFAGLRSTVPDVRALLVVSPNNPTGSYVSRAEVERLSQVCHERGWALIADEVFADYILDEHEPATDLAAANLEPLTFTLGGLSKSVGLPQLKLGWLIVGGPEGARRAAIDALELVADTFLSVGTPVQASASDLLSAAAGVRGAIHQRVRENLACIRRLARSAPATSVLRDEGGWSVVVRVPSRTTEEQLVLDLLARERVLVHPGFFFDFPRESYLVASLLPPPEVFAEGMERVLRFVG
jgi:aspartate/methionine/tyrosine aminotransferase